MTHRTLLSAAILTLALLGLPISVDASTPVTDLTCLYDCTGASVELSWTNTDLYTSITIERNGIAVAIIGGSSTTYSESPPLLFPAAYTVLPECVGTVAAGQTCQPSPAAVFDLSCTRDCGTASVELTWSAAGGYDAIEIYEDGNPVAVLSGADVSYAAMPTGPTVYEVYASCAGVLSDPVSCSVGTVPVPLPQHLILGLSRGGLVDTVGALEAAFLARGDTFVTISSFSELPCGVVPGPDTIVWSITGTFPDNAPLTDEHGQFLVEQILSSGGVYHEGGDTWGFDPATPFSDYDGIGLATDGDDSFTSMAGLDIMAAHGSTYSQDQVGSDFTDQLSLTTDDLGGSDSRVVWEENVLGLNYATGVYYQTDSGMGNVFSQSWELGGYGDLIDPVLDDIIEGVGVPRCIRVDMFMAVQNTTTGVINITWSAGYTGDWVNLKLQIFTPPCTSDVTVTVPMPQWPGFYNYSPPCEGQYNFTLQSECTGGYLSGESVATVEWARPHKRGDSNRDGGFDIGDGIHVLNGLFAMGGFPCEAASDVNNDDMIDIGDAIYALNALFAGGPPPAAPFDECGIDDETPSGLRCDEYDVCL